ncbi:type III pantothenate kinase [Pelagibaculum spongiae]|uniref:Type III pantothenate kinase n=1 Tax=Pelagibaculum spongiae TaxID=2080658 RepID=A0A2V1GSB6_9GAMM|nr:type III pantothenate kinase [Pelagibaculum spongiae]PVZ65767.1 hypothetical protein DC094_18020 [Pelagibaculum spongiae]
MLLIDAGNTFVKWQQFSPSDFSKESSFGQFPLQEPQWEMLHQQINRPLERIMVSSVAGEAFDQKLVKQCQQHSAAPVQLLQSPNEFLQLKNSYFEPERLGIDRWLAMLAVWRETSQGFCLIDCGSAVTVDVVDGQGQHSGGLITPGLEMMRQSLFGGTGRVDRRPSEDSRQSFLACSTFHAVQGGTLYSLVSYIDRIVDEIQATYGELNCVITGGDAEQLVSLLKQSFQMEKGLVFRGLKIFATHSE